MRISIKDILSMKSDLENTYEMNKNISLNDALADVHIKSMRTLRKGIQYLEGVLSAVDVDVDLDHLYLKNLKFKVIEDNKITKITKMNNNIELKKDDEG